VSGSVNIRYGEKTTLLTASIAGIVLFAGAITSRVAVAEDLRCSVFDVSVPGFVGPGALMLAIDHVTGNVTGTFFGDAIQGFYNKVSDEIIFVRSALGSADPARTQVYTGYYWRDAGPNPIDNLAGVFEAFAGSTASTDRHRYGWEASCRIVG
jgi:hypothetical protein